MLVKKIGLDPCQICSDKDLPVQSFSEIVDKHSLQKCRYLVYRVIPVKCESGKDENDIVQKSEAKRNSESADCDTSHQSITEIHKCLGWIEEKRVLVKGPCIQDIDIFVSCVYQLFRKMTELVNLYQNKSDRDPVQSSLLTFFFLLTLIQV
jgi:hypothetical protein